jgi:hypothetical protein
LLIRAIGFTMRALCEQTSQPLRRSLRWLLLDQVVDLRVAPRIEQCFELWVTRDRVRVCLVFVEARDGDTDEQN